MIRDIREAVVELKRNPAVPVVVEIDGMVLEVRPKKRTAAELFREVGAWNGDDAEEVMRRLREAHDANCSEPPDMPEEGGAG